MYSEVKKNKEKRKKKTLGDGAKDRLLSIRYDKFLCFSSLNKLKNHPLNATYYILLHNPNTANRIVTV